MINFYGKELSVFKANLHTHCTVSDGLFTPKQIIDFYSKAGYDVLAFSDHRKTNPVSTYDGAGMTLLSGIELHPKGPRETTWHLLALNVPEDFPGEYETAQEAIDAVNAVGGMVFIAHPHWCGITSADIMTLKGWVGIEVYNSSCRYIGKELNDQCWHELMDAGHLCGALAVDDVHSTTEMFRGWTMIAAPDNTPEALFNALRNKQYYATQGPDFYRLSFENGVFEAEFSDAVDVILSAQTSRGAILASEDWPVLGTRKSINKFSIKLSPAVKFVQCRIIDKNGRQAWTPPVTNITE